jgi:hypothetical protein
VTDLRPLFAAHSLSAGECAYIDPGDGWVYRAGPDHETCHGWAPRPFVVGEIVTLYFEIDGLSCPKRERVR